MPATGRLNAETGAAMGPLEVVGSSRGVGPGRHPSLQLLRGGRLWLLVSPRTGQAGRGQLCGVLVQISLRVCFCRPRGFADLKPPAPRPKVPERWLRCWLLL